jgi:hypothetical protein
MLIETVICSIGCPQFVAEILLEKPGRWYSRLPNPELNSSSLCLCDFVVNFWP